MKIRLHPIMIPFFLVIMASGGISLYALLFISLLIHEAGHLAAARLMKLPVRSCIIMPYGGELVIPRLLKAQPNKRIIVALGGPLATLLLLLCAAAIPFPGRQHMIFIQQVLLLLNLLPFIPLDGGQALCAFIETKAAPYKVREWFAGLSVLFFLTASAAAVMYLPPSLPYLVLAVFLLLQNIFIFRFRKYNKAYELITHNRLTK